MSRQQSTWQWWLFFILLLGVGYASITRIEANAAAVGFDSTTSQLTTQLPAHNIDCLPTAYGLEDLVNCVTSYMPAANSNAYITPTVTIRNEWRTVVADMLSINNISDCSAVTLPTLLAGIYAVFPFTDAYTGHDYCVALEVADANDNGVVDRGWGTFIVNPTPDRFLSIDIPHPIEDSRTNEEGIQIFQGVGAHTFIMAGSNRYANSAESPCQSGESISDVAHCVDNLFFPTVVEIDAFHTTNSTAHTAIQFHGMADGPGSGCPDVNIYITHGSEDAPQTTDNIVYLRDNLRTLQPTWAVAVPGETGLFCGKNGSDNVEGRYLNSGDEAAACGPDLTSYTGKFIHIEQHPDSSLTAYRSPAIWIEALKNTFPALTSPVTTTTLSFQDGMAPDIGYAGTTDTMIRAKYPTTNYGSEAVCEVAGDGFSGLAKEVALRWDISDLPAGSIIHGAEVTLNVTDDTNSTGYYAYALNQDWLENQATWNQYRTGSDWQIAGAQGSLDRVLTPIGRLAPTVTGTYTFTLNPVLVQTWFDTPATNNGILLANPANSNRLIFDCSETSTVSHRPKLTLIYSQNEGGSTPVPTPTVTATPAPTATPTATPTPAAEIIYVSFSTSPTLGGVGYADEDIVAYDTTNASWSLYLDGSDVGLGSSDAKDIDAFYILSNGDILLSFNEATTITGVGDVDDSDIVRFTPTSTGSTTAGSFTLYLDGSDVGLETDAENIVGIALSAEGNLLITTADSGNVGFAFDDDDLLKFAATELGTNTTGTWSLFFEGSDVGLGGEDIRDFWVDSSNNIYFTLLNEFEPVGDQYDLYLCVPGSLGSTTTCTGGISQYWDGSADGINGWRPDGLFIAR